jgi:hypothetical protein
VSWKVYSDPFQHALIAAGVAAPLVASAGPRVLATAAGAAVAIDVDHAVAARSLRVRAMISLATRPRSHSLLTALGAGSVVTVAAGPAHGWATFSGLVSHLLHDAGDAAAPTPLLWPFAAPRQLGRRWQVVATAALMLGSAAISYATASASASGDGDGTSPPRTA